LRAARNSLGVDVIQLLDEPLLGGRRPVLAQHCDPGLAFSREKKVQAA